MVTYYKILLLQYLRSPYTYLAFALPITLLLGFGWMIPVGLIIPSAISVGIMAIIFFLFGSNILEIRKTSMIKSFSMTKISKTLFLIINVSVSLLLSFIVLAMFLFLAWFLTSVIPFLALDYSFFSDPENVFYIRYLNFSINWDQAKWLTFFYGFAFTVIMSYMLAFLFISISKTSTFYYLVSFMYIFAFMFLTDAFVPDFFTKVSDVRRIVVFVVPHTYTNHLMVLSLTVNSNFLDLLENSVLVKTPDQFDPQIVAAFDQLRIFLHNLAPMESWNWSAINSDINHYNNLLANDNLKSAVDNPDEWNSQLFIYLTTPFIIEIPGPAPALEYSTLHILLYPIYIPSVGSIGGYIEPERFGSIMESFYNNRNYLIYYTNKTPLWNFHNLESILNSFVPLVFSFFLYFVSIKRFEWSVR